MIWGYDVAWELCTVHGAIQAPENMQSSQSSSEMQRGDGMTVKHCPTYTMLLNPQKNAERE